MEAQLQMRGRGDEKVLIDVEKERPPSERLGSEQTVIRVKKLTVVVRLVPCPLPYIHDGQSPQLDPWL